MSTMQCLGRVCRFLPPLLMLAATLSGCAGPGGASSPNAGITPKTLNVAEVAMRSGDPVTALHVAKAVLLHNPGNRDARRVEASALYAMDRLPEAARIDHELYRDTNAPRDLLAYARCVIRSDPKRATAALKRYLALRPDAAAAYTDLGVAYDLQGKSGAARKAYRQALARNGEDLAAKVDLGLSLVLSGNSATALPMLAEAARMAPDNPRIRGDYAAALAMAGHEANAARLLARDLPEGEAKLAARAYASAGIH